MADQDEDDIGQEIIIEQEGEEEEQKLSPLRMTMMTRAS
jgi:hypothetical protein